jgi:hypothetical protein
MLTTLLMCLLLQVPDQSPDFSAFQYEKPQPKITKPEKPKEYFASDKFGKRWKSLSKDALRDKIQEMNQLPWEMKDDEGIVWKNQDPVELERFVKQRNENNRISREYFLQWNSPRQLQKFRIQPETVYTPSVPCST